MEVARPWSTGTSSGMLMTPQVPYSRKYKVRFFRFHMKIPGREIAPKRRRKSQMRVPLSLGRARLVHTRPAETHSEGT